MTIPNEFAVFYYRNADVYYLLVALARDWQRATGRGKLGMRMLWERMRWDISMTTTVVDESDYKFNDHFPPYYARVIMHFEQDLDGMFDIRSSDADIWLADFIQRGGKRP